MTQMSKIEAPPDNLIGALARALPELGAVTKNKKNPHFKSSYADLSAVIAALAPLADHGVWFRQEPRDTDDAVGFETFYIYKDGSELSAGVTRIPVNKRDAQGYGSAQTYCRRYALQAAFGLAADDDDGNAAAKARPEPQAQERQPISDDQWATIVTLVQSTKIPPDEVKKHVGATNLKMLTPKQYDDAIDYLNDKLAKLAKAETDAMATEDA